MNIYISYWLDKASYVEEWSTDCVPCVGDHILLGEVEHIVVGRLYFGPEEVKVFVKKTTSSDVAFV